MAVITILHIPLEWAGVIPIQTGGGILGGVIRIITEVIAHGIIHGIIHAVIATDIMTGTAHTTHPTIITMDPGNLCPGQTEAQLPPMNAVPPIIQAIHPIELNVMM